MTIAIIDYGAGNLRSAAKALELAAAGIGSTARIVVTADPDVVAKADHVVLPGDGAFADCRTNLDSVDGMIEAINETIDAKGRPFLGICVGMQLLATRGIEYGVTKGLGRIPGEVRRIEPSDPRLKIPHMGWNTLNASAPHPLLDGIALGDDGWHAYFLHAYQLFAEQPGDVIATADYGGPVTAIVTTGNIAGTQFHPEKSQKLGLALLANFLKWKP
ncbi:imidazole glycerol phosphate synthase subunit HisH [Kaistia sp. 32K]|uniref:imidazole glycerol phosphate synthase subunit HisH n=1 Tax=Kaistia sp. 32K TaxID=2795690 RepID=UPI001916BACF|nr:imidazole glycerol phosphate synthase subunit HisH [Kaistia sp. 32K]BCP55808.1 imidazole glycerol phosphate synthase subunit HisH [Kaistia sp. 32K]